MKGSLVIVSFFILGCISGLIFEIPDSINLTDISSSVLYVLMFLVGAGIGCDGKIKEIIKFVRPQLLLLPLSTIVGTLSFSALAALILPQWTVWDCLAVGSGMAYYSLSSILIMQLKAPVAGAAVASQLGAIALISNIVRELIALVGAPFFARYFGKFAPISAGGATTMDTTLPIITQVSGQDIVILSIFHGILVDLSVPFLVSFFASF